MTVSLKPFWRRLAGALHAKGPLRRRKWRYVSTRRRRVGLFALAALLLLFYGGRYFTRGEYVRQQAMAALEELTGGDVEIESASFRVFGGIRLHGVKIRPRGDTSPYPFFSAEEVMLRHKAGGLFFRARIEPIEIVCTKPVITLEHDQRTGETNAVTFFEAASQENRPASSGPMGPLPRITLIDGLLRSVIKDGPVRRLIYEVPIHGSLLPEGDGLYDVSVTDSRTGGSSRLWTSIQLNTDTGEFLIKSGRFSTELAKLLPPEQRQWVQRYGVEGYFAFLPKPANADDSWRLGVRVLDYELKLPKAESGLHLSGKVREGEESKSEIHFWKDRVEIKNFRGEIAQMPGATFTLNGQYSGYEKTSPFSMKIAIENLSLQGDKDVSGDLKENVDFIRRRFDPRGKGDVTMTYSRGDDGEHRCDGQLELKDMELTFSRFPLPTQKVRGTVHFTEKGADTFDLTGRAGLAKLVLKGKILDPPASDFYDIQVEATDLAFDQTLRKALPDRFQKIWERITPSGTTNARVRISQLIHKDREGDIAVELIPQGQTNLTYADFPYPMRNLTTGKGKITYRDNVVTIPSLEGRDGQKTYRFSGTISQLDKPTPNVKIAIVAGNIPIDSLLLGALGEKARKQILALKPAGLARRVEATLTQKPEGPLQYNIQMGLADGAFTYERFPYRIEQAAGELTITQDKVTLDKIVGRHGQTKATISGEILLDEAMNYDMNVAATSVLFDKELRKTLPPEVREVWDELQPGGLADVTLHLATNPKQPDADPVYRVAVDARAMTIQPTFFPYPFQNVTGQALITPGLATLTSFQAREGKMTATFGGTVAFTKTHYDASLAMVAKNLPIDKVFLGAIDPKAVPLVRRVTPSGTVDVNLASLRIHRPIVTKKPAPTPTKTPVEKKPPAAPPAASAPKAVVPAVAAKAESWWKATGNIAFTKAKIDVGFGPQTMSGTLTKGTIGQIGEALTIAADVKLDGLQWKSHRLTALTGKIAKTGSRDVLRFEKVAGRLHGGRVTGPIDIRLGDPIGYTLSAEVQNIDLDKLVNAGVTDPKKRVAMKGLVSGRVALQSTESFAGKPATQMAEGQLEIAQAKLYKLPVFLGMLNIIYLSLPGDAAFTSGFMTYELRNNKLRINEIFLTGNTLSVLGSGTVDLKSDKLNLTFLTGPPGKLPRLSELAEEFLQALSREIVEIRVTGTLKNPKMKTVPLKTLETIIRRLLAPSLESK